VGAVVDGAEVVGVGEVGVGDGAEVVGVGVGDGADVDGVGVGDVDGVGVGVGDVDGVGVGDVDGVGVGVGVGVGDVDGEGEADADGEDLADPDEAEGLGETVTGGSVTKSEGTMAFAVGAYGLDADAGEDRGDAMDAMMGEPPASAPPELTDPVGPVVGDCLPVADGALPWLELESM